MYTDFAKVHRVLIYYNHNLLLSQEWTVNMQSQQKITHDTIEQINKKCPESMQVTTKTTDFQYVRSGFQIGKVQIKTSEQTLSDYELYAMIYIYTHTHTKYI